MSYMTYQPLNTTCNLNSMMSDIIDIIHIFHYFHINYRYSLLTQMIITFSLQKTCIAIIIHR